MNNLTNYILEKLKINKDSKQKQYKYYPQTKSELKDIIKKLLKERGKNADLNDIDTSKITDMSSLFFREFPHNINISEWDVSNVENMGIMFMDCHDFNCDLSKWNVKNVKDMRYMFNHCHKFKGEGLENWKVASNTIMFEMFQDCDLIKNKKPSWYKNN